MRHRRGNERADTRKIVATYSYRDGDGNVLFQVLRGDPKSFWLRQPDGDGWQWNLNGVMPTLYRLPQLLAAKPKSTVFVVEGEKDADNLAKLGLVATTNPGGAGKWRCEFSNLLRDRKVTILPDNDDAGRRHATNIADSLLKTAKTIRIVTLPELPLHGDISDWIDAGGTKSELLRLVKETPRLTGTVQEHPIIFRTPLQLGASKNRPVDWVVPPFVAGGCITVIVGKVKAAGKTTFVTNMASALVRGKKFLGRPTEKGPVVCMTEQPTASWLEALKRARLSKRDDFFSVQWCEVAGQPWDKLTKAALAVCKRHGARLLIIDTLAPFAGLSGATENDAGHALDAMKPLQTVTAAGIGIVIVQHERKSGGDVGESGRGSTAFAGAADIILTLSRRMGRGQETLRDLHALSRFSETPQSLMIELTDDGYVSRGKIRPIATERAQTAILAVLPNEKKDATTVEQIIEESGCSRTSAQRALNILRNRHAASRRGKGTKTSPHRFWRN